MTHPLLPQLECLSDALLTRRLHEAIRGEWGATARVVAHLAEFEGRRLHLPAGCPSLYAYCTTVLHLSEHAAYGRVAAARAVRRWPLILDYLDDGRLTLTAVVLVAPELSGANHRELLDTVTHRPRRWIEAWLAERRPAPPIDDRIRRLPARGADSGAGGTRVPVAPPGAILHPVVAPPPPEVVPSVPPPEFPHPEPRDAEGPQPGATPADAPATRREVPSPQVDPGAREDRISPLDRAVYRVQFTARADTYRRLMQVRELLRHRVPDGDLGAIFDRALRLLHLELARRRYALVQGGAARSAAAAVAQGPPAGRHIPNAVRRAVWSRDGGRCTFTGTEGRRCAATGGLEFHHRVPYARGGGATEENLELRCRAHNLYEEAGPGGYA